MISVLHLVKQYRGNYPLLNEMARLDGRRFRTVVCYLGGRPDGRNEMDRLAARTAYLEYPSSRMRWYNLSLLLRLRRLLEEERIDIVNCHLHRTVPLGVGAALLARNRPLVFATIHGLAGSGGWGRQLQNRLLFPRLHRLVAISNGVRDDILAGNPWLAPEKVATVLNGLEFGPFLQDGDRVALRQQLFPGIDGRFWFGTAGRLSAVKNQTALLQAFQRVLRQEPDCTLLMAGRGELEESLRRQAAELGIEGRVHFLGHRQDMGTVLKCFDCFVLPSLREGLSLALLEAMASALPVVASRVGGIPEVVSDESMGRLVAPGDTEALADAMLLMARTPMPRLAQYGENSRRRAMGQFGAQRMRSDYEALFEASVPTPRDGA
jgi:glycosyltransferase involved in cell wall biosynthesis